MPYESFQCTRPVMIDRVVQDPISGSWRYEVTIQRRLEDSGHSQYSPLSPPMTTPTYTVSRSLRDFKRLHAGLKPLMGSALPSFPSESLFASILGENATTLEKKRPELENLLRIMDTHPAASDASEYLDFISDKETVPRPHNQKCESSMNLKNCTMECRLVEDLFYLDVLRPEARDDMYMLQIPRRARQCSLY